MRTTKHRSELNDGIQVHPLGRRREPTGTREPLVRMLAIRVGLAFALLGSLGVSQRSSAAIST